MLWRLTRAQFDRQKGEANRRAMRAVVASGEPPGILAYHGNQAIGWCAVAPRERYPALERSRVLKPIDDAPVWSVSCLFVDKRYRRQGVSVRLLNAAVAYVRRRGGRLVEGYPIDPNTDDVPAPFAWTGLMSAFTQSGFAEVARGSATRPIMRYEIDPHAPRSRGST